MKNLMRLIIGSLFISGIALGSFVVPDSGITTRKLADDSVTTQKIAVGAVTNATRAPLGQVVSSTSTGTASTSSTSYVDITNATLTITTIGRPVLIGLEPDGTTSNSDIGAVTTSGTNTAAQAFFQLDRDASVISTWVVQNQFASTSSTSGVFPASSLIFLDTGASSGSHTYKFQFHSGSANGGAVCNFVKIFAFEL